MRSSTARLRWIAPALILALALDQAQGQAMNVDRVQLPGSTFEVVLDPAAAHHRIPPGPALISAIGAWLSFSFDLPPAAEPPTFRFASLEELVALRHRGVPSDHRSDTTVGATGPTEQPDILALYDSRARTIHLREDWRGDTAAGLSVVVHELVHHQQNMAALKFACGEAREEMAFAAQEQWLGLFGQNLETEFGLDPFTLFVRTNCPM
jgi:hypothetical protein